MAFYLHSLTPLSIFLLLTFLSTSSTSATQEDFIQCFRERTSCSKNATTTQQQILHTPHTTSYTTLFFSDARNNRSILSSRSHMPALIVTPAEPSHVQAAVLCGRDHGLRIRTRSGGHDYEGLSYVSTTRADPFAIVDLRNFRNITVDLRSNTAWAEAGATTGELYYRIAKASPVHAFPAGICSTIGLGGHLSGGGIGTMMRKFGLGADNVVDALLVDADGKLFDRRAMGEDFFWAIRGGGAASFGILLSYKLRLVTVPPRVTVFNIRRIPEQDLTKIMTRWENMGSFVREDLFIRAMVLTTPRDQNRSVGVGGANTTLAVLFQCLFLGGKAELFPYLGVHFPELGVKVGELTEVSWIDSVKYFAGFSNGSTDEILLDRTVQTHAPMKAKSDFVKKPIGEKGWERLWEFLLGARDERVAIIVDPMGGVMDSISEGETPFPHRKGNLYNIQYYMRWNDTEKDGPVTKRHLDWMRELYDFMAPYVSKNPRAAYVNYRDLDLGRNVEAGDSCHECARPWGTKYFKGNFERLTMVKGKVDPHNFFWSEQSIPPHIDSDYH